MCLDQINDPPSLTSVQEQMLREEREYRASTQYSGSFPSLQYFIWIADIFIFITPPVIFLIEMCLSAF